MIYVAFRRVMSCQTHSVLLQSDLLIHVCVLLQHRREELLLISNAPQSHNLIALKLCVKTKLICPDPRTVQQSSLLLCHRTHTFAGSKASVSDSFKNTTQIFSPNLLHANFTCFLLLVDNVCFLHLQECQFCLAECSSVSLRYLDTDFSSR